jgi:hypothetical protein
MKITGLIVVLLNPEPQLGGCCSSKRPASQWMSE